MDSPLVAPLLFAFNPDLSKMKASRRTNYYSSDQMEWLISKGHEVLFQLYATEFHKLIMDRPHLFSLGELKAVKKLYLTTVSATMKL